MNPTEFKEKLKAIDLVAVRARAIRDRKEDAEDWQREQLWSGKTSTGGNISPKYRPLTIKRKKKKGQPYDRVTFKDTGDLYDAVYMDNGLYAMAFGSEDYKEAFAELRSGTKIWGLNKISSAGFRGEVIPVFVRLLKREMKK